MSFSDLKKSDYTRKKKEITFDVNGKTLTFYANEISHFEKQDVLSSLSNNQEWVTKFVVYSITDERGARMSKFQAGELPEDIATKFLDAAIEVNPFDSAEAKKN